MRKGLYLVVSLLVLPLLAMSTSTAPVGFGLAYWLQEGSNHRDAVVAGQAQTSAPR